MLSYETEKGIIVDHMGEMKQGGDWARTWLHAGVKVEVIAVRDRDPGLDQELPDGAVATDIQCWSENAETGICSEVRTLSEAAE